MQMRKIYCFRSFALDSAHVKFDVWDGPEILKRKENFKRSDIKNKMYKKLVSASQLWRIVFEI